MLYFVATCCTACCTATHVALSRHTATADRSSGRRRTEDQVESRGTAEKDAERLQATCNAIQNQTQANPPATCLPFATQKLAPKSASSTSPRRWPVRPHCPRYCSHAAAGHRRSARQRRLLTKPSARRACAPLLTCATQFSRHYAAAGMHCVLCIAGEAHGWVRQAPAEDYSQRSAAADALHGRQEKRP